MFSRLRETLAIMLIGLLPLHALLVTVLTKLIAGSDKAPLAAIALWKEGVLGVVLVVAIAEIVSAKVRKSESTKVFRFDAIDVCILLSLAIACVLLTAHRSQLIAFLLGFKYDFIPLIAFLILRRVSWSPQFQLKVTKVIVIVGAIVVAYGILSFFLPMEFFVWLGYSDLHSLYAADGPLAAFQQIGGSSLQRIQSTMSGPNQLGLWLLIPLGVMLVNTGIKGTGFLQQGTKGAGFYPRLFCGAVLVVALFLTFSRAAWIAAAVMIVLALVPWIRTIPRRLLACFSVCALLILIPLVLLFPDVILRAASSRDHLARPLAALHLMLEHPLGLGLGSAGPASNRTSDTCVMVESTADAAWAANRQDLCVFVDGAQIQPVGRTCSCPLLTENWYVQWGVEMGVLGLIVSILIVVFVLKALPKQSFIFIVFLGVSIAALFLHAWEDAAVAYTVWVLVAATLARQKCVS